MHEILQSIILGLIEGITEFIPVSSTGHLILAGHLIGFEGQRATTFEVFIQLGAILSILIIYRDRFIGLFQHGDGFYGVRAITLLSLTTIPAVLTGILAHGLIKKYLFTPLTVIIGLFIGGLWIVIAEAFYKKETFKKSGINIIGIKEAFFIGLFQCLALWPGISRAASTILGGMHLGFDRKTSAEYSFLAAVPVIFGASLYDLYKSRSFLSTSDIPIFGIGFIVSFLSALIAVRTFIYILGRFDLRGFGWYRLALSVLLFYLL